MGRHLAVPRAGSCPSGSLFASTRPWVGAGYQPTRAAVTVVDIVGIRTSFANSAICSRLLAQLVVAKATVERHIANIMAELGCAYVCSDRGLGSGSAALQYVAA